MVTSDFSADGLLFGVECPRKVGNAIRVLHCGVTHHALGAQKPQFELPKVRGGRSLGGKIVLVSGGGKRNLVARLIVGSRRRQSAQLLEDPSSAGGRRSAINGREPTDRERQSQR